MPETSPTVEAFLARAGWQDATRTSLAGDASVRAYTRLMRRGETAILMDASRIGTPVVGPFARIGTILGQNGFSTPETLCLDEANGLLLLEDFGDAVFARLIEDDPARERPLYEAAVDMLCHLAVVTVPHDLPVYTVHHLAALVDPVFDDYAAALGAPVPRRARGAIATLLEAALLSALPRGKTLSLRDCHAENLIWLPMRAGIARVGLLDYQDAVVTNPAYDLVSLLQDARRDVPDDLAIAMQKRFVATGNHDPKAFGAAYAVLGLQRNLRILGIFARLALKDRKTRYLSLMPRVWGHVERNLTHPSLKHLAQPIRSHLPAPTPDRLARLADHATA